MWRSIIHLGDVDNQRYPSVWFEPSGRLYVAQSGPNGQASVVSPAPFFPGPSVAVKIVVQSNHALIRTTACCKLYICCRTLGRRPHDAVAFFAEMAESRFSFPLLRS